ncbi:MAG TPA: hypothetical protein VIG88_05910 [Lysobacter sp.]
MTAAHTLVSFECNICDADNSCDPRHIGREDASCSRCGSSVRLRSIVDLVARAVLGESLPLSQFPIRTDIFGLGLSDWSVYARQLALRFSYVNTYYHTAPRLDITSVPDALAGTMDFLVATDVFEHVLPPVSLAFAGARKLLRSGGVFIFSVPFDDASDETVEHFPHLHEFHLQGDSCRGYVLHNRRQDGKEEVFGDLIFHGGPGSTLEMRVFSGNGLVKCFKDAGFSEVTFAEEVPRWGIYWPKPYSLPLVARV